jgi:lysozyme family protein
MSDFLTAHKKVMSNEGGVNYNPADRGNVVVKGIVTIPTYKGIAPAFWPKWGGWKYITGCVCQLVKMPAFGTTEYYNWAKHLNHQLAGLSALQQLVFEFYKVNFWKRLGEIEDQTLATWVYDKDVNTGDNGSRWLQEAAHITVDGKIGAITLAAVNKADAFTLLQRMKTLAVDHYLHEAQKPHQKGFWKSWISRVELSPEKLVQANSEARNLGIIV